MRAFLVWFVALVSVSMGDEPIFKPAAKYLPSSPPEKTPAVQAEEKKLSKTIDKILGGSSKDDKPELWIFLPETGTETTDILYLGFDSDSYDLPFKPIFKVNAPDWLKPSIVQRPSFYWAVDQPKIAGATSARIFNGYKNILNVDKNREEVIQAWRNTVTYLPTKKAAVKAEPRIHFGSGNWTYNGGRVTIQHLREHGCPEWVIQKYKHDQNALDRLHGAFHERGSIF